MKSERDCFFNLKSNLVSLGKVEPSSSFMPEFVQGIVNNTEKINNDDREKYNNLSQKVNRLDIQKLPITESKNINQDEKIYPKKLSFKEKIVIATIPLSALACSTEDLLGPSPWASAARGVAGVGTLLASIFGPNILSPLEKINVSRTVAERKRTDEENKLARELGLAQRPYDIVRSEDWGDTEKIIKTFTRRAFFVSTALIFAGCTGYFSQIFGWTACGIAAATFLIRATKHQK